MFLRLRHTITRLGNATHRHYCLIHRHRTMLGTGYSANLPDPAVDGDHSCSGFSIVVERASPVCRHDPSKLIERICDRERDSGS